MEENKKKFDLEDRTEKFAHECRKFIRSIKMDICNNEDCKHLARSSGSVSANYIEANESCSKKDYLMRIKICRKEAKESRLWLRLLHIEGKYAQERILLINEATELMNIFGAIIRKTEISLKETKNLIEKSN
ncbi:MAG: four helix bundle protein [Cytophagaceae bacterium]